MFQKKRNFKRLGSKLAWVAVYNTHSSRRCFRSLDRPAFDPEPQLSSSHLAPSARPASDRATKKRPANLKIGFEMRQNVFDKFSSARSLEVDCEIQLAQPIFRIAGIHSQISRLHLNSAEPVALSLTTGFAARDLTHSSLRLMNFLAKNIERNHLRRRFGVWGS